MKEPILPLWVKERKGRLIAGLIFLAYLASGTFTVKDSEGEQGVALIFGSVVREKINSGMSWNPPWPIGKVEKVRTAVPYKMCVGFKCIDQLRNLPPTPQEVEWLTGDTNILNIQVILQYVVSNPVESLYTADSPRILLKKAAEAQLTEIIAGMKVDDVLTTGKLALLEKLKIRTNEVLDSYGIGLKIVSANFDKVEPTPPVKSAFNDVQNAEAEKAKKVSEAMGYSNDVLPKARGEAQQIISQAEGGRKLRVNTALGESQRIKALMIEYEKAPQHTKNRLYIEAMEKILPAVKKYVVDSSDGKDPVSMKLIEEK